MRIGFAFIAAAALSSVAQAGEGQHAVYTMTNAAAGNEVVRFAPDIDGALVETGRFSTGGRGNGGGLGSQGALAFARGGRLLLAVNAGSDDISVFAVEGNALRLTDRRPAGGTVPVSVAAHDRRVFVLDAGGAGNIAGFSLDDDGRLAPLDDAVRPLSRAGAAPAQIAFSPDGRSLVVTERATGCLSVYALDGGVLPAAPVCTPSAGRVPFGFDFTSNGTLVVSEAGSGSASSYDLHGGALRVVSASVPTTQLAPCWLITTGDGSFAFTANAGSDTISSFRIGARGDLTLVAAAAPSGGRHPIDLAVSQNGQMLYVLDNFSGDVAGYAIAADGTLTPTTAAAGLPASSAGLLAQ